MALSAGVLSLTVEFAKDIKDRDWFCRQDPYCIIRVGAYQRRSKTAVNGGRNPVWNETFQFNLINENDVEVEIKDDDIGRDAYIGSCTFNVARAREMGSDRLNVPVMSKKSQKQHGFIAVALMWAPNVMPINTSPVAQAVMPYYAPQQPQQPQVLVQPSAPMLYADVPAVPAPAAPVCCPPSQQPQYLAYAPPPLQPTVAYRPAVQPYPSYAPPPTTVYYPPSSSSTLPITRTTTMAIITTITTGGALETLKSL